MAITPLLQLPETSRTQIQWDQSINDAFAGLERATQDVKSLDFTAGDISLTSSDQSRFFLFEALNVLGARVLTLDSSISLVQASRRFISVSSDIANVGDVAIKVSGNAATLVTLTPGSSALLYIKGTVVYVLGSYGVTSVSPSLSYDISVYISGLPPVNQEIYRMAVTQDLSIGINMSGSRASARINPTSIATFNVNKNGALVGTAQFNTSGTHVFQSGAVILLAPGDILTIDSPVVQDATLEDAAITIFGVKL